MQLLIRSFQVTLSYKRPITFVASQLTRESFTFRNGVIRRLGDISLNVHQSENSDSIFQKFWKKSMLCFTQYTINMIGTEPILPAIGIGVFNWVRTLRANAVQGSSLTYFNPNKHTFSKINKIKKEIKRLLVPPVRLGDGSRQVRLD